MGFPETTQSSPNFSATPPHEKLGVLFHHSVLPFHDAIGRLTDPASAVSYHCLIGHDGTRCTLVPDDVIAWHAGESAFLGRTRCNDFLLGVAFAGDSYLAPLTPEQLGSAIERLASRWTRYGWTIDRMTDHRQVAPRRKDDLNPVEWHRLRALIATTFSP